MGCEHLAGDAQTWNGQDAFRRQEQVCTHCDTLPSATAHTLFAVGWEELAGPLCKLAVLLQIMRYGEGI